MNYDRKVRYFDYKKDGERLRGAGFAKIEVRGEVCKLQIQISGLHMTDTFSKQIYLVAMDREEELGTIEMQRGKGSLQKQLAVDNLCKGISYRELVAFRIPIAAGYELYCEVRDDVISESNPQVIEVKAASVVEQTMEESSDGKAEQSDELLNDIETEQSSELLNDIEAEQSVDVENDSEIELEIEVQEGMLGSKWEQISAIYPHIQPFQDGRDYLKVAPEDFVILGRRSYQLAHNSFLLHGYYNYKHLILTRHDWRNEERYYIGVPGNFYEREKQVALMFGFESFECKEEPANMGDYGYYMIRVDI